MKNLYKIIFSVLLSLFAIGLNAQNHATQSPAQKVSPQEWYLMKSSGTPMDHVIMFDANAPINVLHPVIHRALNSQSLGCNGFIPLDTSFQVVPFVSAIGPDYKNDDYSSPLITLPFTFCFYGNSYNQVYINNNGNISFDSPYSTFSPVDRKSVV